jgi:beta-phosphoglucomutase-like phosphatase (HAD superfamily)
MLTFDTTRYDAAIFDCDGTLVDTMPLHHAAWQAAFARFQAPFEFTWDLFQRRAGMTLERTVEELNVEFGCELPPSLVADAEREEYRRRSDQIVPIDYVVRFAREVAGCRPVAVASGSSRASVEHALGHVGLLDCFHTIVTAGDVREGKPSPETFLLAASRLSVPPDRCLVVEDGELGLEAARRAGMDAYRVGRDGEVSLRRLVRRPNVRPT